jgi:hypothetical protein
MLTAILILFSPFILLYSLYILYPIYAIFKALVKGILK